MLPADRQSDSPHGVPGRVGSAFHLVFQNFPARSARRTDFATAGTVLILALAFFCGAIPARAQEQRKSKLPVIDKITGGSSKQAFSGIVESVDMKRKLLNVNTVEGGNVEIFPVKKGISVSAANGSKLKLTELTPGTNVIIYYEQKGDRRAVEEIVVLTASPAEEKKKSPPPS